MPKSEKLISIFIATLDNRREKFSILMDRLNEINIYGDDVEIVVDSDSGQRTLGEKRNDFLRSAKGKYIVMVDDDDWIADEYIHYMVKAADSGCDCASLVGKYYIDGVFYMPFYHSIRYSDWTQDKNGYYRCPNHLNLIKKELINGVYFRGKDYKRGMDYEWSMQIQKQGKLKNEFEISQVLYHYYDGKK